MSIALGNRLSLSAAGLAVFIFMAGAAWGEDAPVTLQTAPPLAYGVSQVIQLSQAQVSDGTIVTYIRNSGNSYGLDASQIVYLRQQGVSEAVVSAMLTQPRAGSSSPVSYSPPPISAPAPAVAYVQPQPAPEPPASSVYVIPDTQTYSYYNNFYSYYGRPYYSSVCVIGGGYYGGYRSGWHGGFGGGWHGGWHR